MESSHAAFVSFRPSYLPQNVSLDRQQPSPLSSPPQRFIQLSSKFDLPHLHSCKQILNFTSFHNPRLHHPRNHPGAFSSSFVLLPSCFDPIVSAHHHPLFPCQHPLCNQPDARLEPTSLEFHLWSFLDASSKCCVPSLLVN